METITRVIINIFDSRNEEDIIDRLNYRYTAYIFVFCNLILTSKLYFGTPIQCWTPAEFKRGWTEYTRDYCLVENTYYLPIDNPEMPVAEIREDKKLPYYQWVQFILVLMAFAFYLPHIIWRSVNWQSGIQVRAIINEAQGASTDQPEKLQQIAKHINDSMKFAKMESKFYFFRGSQKYLTAWYILVKLLWLLITALQLALVYFFIDLSYFDVIETAFGLDPKWKSTGVFPRSTMCDFEIRTKGNIQKYSVQCVLQLNMLNEKIFLFIFIWLTLLIGITLTNICMWLVHLGAKSRQDYARKMLKIAGVAVSKSRGNTTEKAALLGAEERHKYQHFIENVNCDEIILLRLISSNWGDLVASDVTKALFDLRYNSP